MKQSILYIVILTFISISCWDTSVQKEYPETYYSKVTGIIDFDEIRKEMIRELYSFYNSSDKKNNFYEVLWSKRILINYNRVNKTLNISDDICSGWFGKFKNVEEKDIKFLSDNRIEFSKYKLYLTPLGEVMKTETNAPCLSKLEQ